MAPRAEVLCPLLVQMGEKWVWEAASLFEEMSFQPLLEDVQQRVEAGCFPHVYFLHEVLMGLGRVVVWLW